MTRHYQLMNKIEAGDGTLTNERDFISDLHLQVTNNLEHDFAAFMKVHDNVIAGLISRY